MREDVIAFLQSLSPEDKKLLRTMITVRTGAAHPSAFVKDEHNYVSLVGFLNGLLIALKMEPIELEKLIDNS